MDRYGEPSVSSRPIFISLELVPFHELLLIFGSFEIRLSSSLQNGGGLGDADRPGAPRRLTGVESQREGVIEDFPSCSGKETRERGKRSVGSTKYGQGRGRCEGRRIV